MNIKIQLVE